MKTYTQEQIDELAEILRNDGVISVPTDTIFGICARVNSKTAYENLIKAKNRPLSKLFPIMCADIEQINSIAIIEENSKILINAFMPGPITLILKSKSNLPKYANNGGTTVAIRMATSNVLKELIKKTGSPIFLTSANQSGMPTCTNLNEIEKACPSIDGMMEGTISFGKGSTIVDCSNNEIKILREGPITMEKIQEKLYNC